MMNKIISHLIEEQKEGFEDVRKTYGLRFIILHGSFVTGRERKESDVDTALVEDQPLTMDGFFAVHEALDNIFSRYLEMVEIDLKSLKGVDPLFRYQVVAHSFLLAGDTRRYNEFKMYAFRAYMDSSDLRILERRMIEYKQQMLDKRYG